MPAEAPEIIVQADGEPTDSAIAAIARLLLAVADDAPTDGEPCGALK